MTTESLRILWSSNAPWARTGYGNQTAVFVPRIKALGHEIAIQAWYGLEGGFLNWNGVPVYPKAFHAFGQDIFSAHAANFGADIAITLIDAWVMEPRMHGQHTRWLPWFPIDMEPVPPPIVEKVMQSFACAVYSKFGLTEARKAGLDPFYIPHGVDTNLFKPIKKEEARARLKISPDVFVVGMIAANKGTPSRKCFPQQIEAFAQLHRKHSDTVLLLHTSKGENGEGQGVNLPELVRSLGLEVGTDVLFADQYMQIMGFPDEYMLDTYNALDVLMNVSMGEGFGLPILEAQACGTPVITGDWTAMPELTFGGWKVGKDEAERTWTPLAAYQFMPRIGAIAERLEEAYLSRVIWGPKCRAGAKEYDADKVTQEFWKPALEEVAERVHGVKVIKSGVRD